MVPQPEAIIAHAQSELAVDIPQEDIRRPPLPVKRIVAQAAIFWGITRLGYIVFTYVYVTAIRYQSPTLAHLTQPWQYYDSNWYLLASHGYPTPPTTAFFPLFPMLVAAVRFFGVNDWVAMWAVSNVATLAAFAGAGLWAAQEDPEVETANILRMLCVFPYAYFLFVPYAESLFIALAAFSFLAARRGHWWASALCAFCCGLARPMAVALVVPLAWEFGRQQGWWEHLRRGQLALNWRSGDERRRIFARIGQFTAIVGAVPAAIGLFMLYLWRHTGDPFAFLAAEKQYWSEDTSGVLQSLLRLGSSLFLTPNVSPHDRTVSFITLGALLFCLGFAIVAWRSMPRMYAMYLGGLLLLALNDPVNNPYAFYSTGRFMLEALPAFFLLACWARKRAGLDMGITTLGLFLQALFMIAFFSRIWVE